MRQTDCFPVVPLRDGRVCWLMLNPSTADEDENDPTITRCIIFASDWGFSGGRSTECGATFDPTRYYRYLLWRPNIIVANIFAGCATDPMEMKKMKEPIGPENDGYILQAALESPLVICAWGTKGRYLKRAAAVLELLRANGVVPHYLKLTKGGEPSHPLYLKRTLVPIPLPLPVSPEPATAVVES